MKERRDEKREGERNKKRRDRGEGKRRSEARREAVGGQSELTKDATALITCTGVLWSLKQSSIRVTLQHADHETLTYRTP